MCCFDCSCSRPACCDPASSPVITLSPASKYQSGFQFAAGLAQPGMTRQDQDRRVSVIAVAATPTLVGLSPSHAAAATPGTVDPSPRDSQPVLVLPIQALSAAPQSPSANGVSLFTPPEAPRRIAKAPDKEILAVWSDAILSLIAAYAYSDFKDDKVTIDCTDDNVYLKIMKSGVLPDSEQVNRFARVAWRYVPKIKEINARDWHIASTQLTFLATHCVALEKVHVSAYNLKSTDFRALQQVPALRELRLERCRSITSTIFLLLHKCLKLEMVVLNGARLLFESPKLLANGRIVRAFSQGTMMTMKELMQKVRSLANITSDEMTYSRELDQQTGDAEDFARTCVSDPQGLTKLGVENCAQENSVVESLEELAPGMKRLSISSDSGAVKAVVSGLQSVE